MITRRRPHMTAVNLLQNMLILLGLPSNATESKRFEIIAHDEIIPLQIRPLQGSRVKRETYV